MSTSEWNDIHESVQEWLRGHDSAVSVVGKLKTTVVNLETRLEERTRELGLAERKITELQANIKSLQRDNMELGTQVSILRDQVGVNRGSNCPVENQQTASKVSFGAGGQQTHVHVDTVGGQAPSIESIGHPSYPQPPLGLHPAKIALEARIRERITEIEEAIRRYLDAGVPVPVDWYKELVDHQNFIEQHSANDLTSH